MSRTSAEHIRNQIINADSLGLQVELSVTMDA